MTASILHLLVAGILGFLAVTALGTLRSRSRFSTVVVLVVLVGLTYDNAVLAVGRWLGHGPLLEGLSFPRFVLHAATTPLLILVALATARAAELPWSRTRAARISLWALTAAMILWGLVTDVVLLELNAETTDGVVSYGNGAATLPVPALVTILVLVVVGAPVWRGVGWPWLAVGAGVMLVASGLGSISGLLTNVGELALGASLVATEQVAGRWRRVTRPAASVR